MKTKLKPFRIALAGLSVLTLFAASLAIARPAPVPVAEDAAPPQAKGSPWKVQWHGKGNFLDVHFVDANHVWAVGSKGLILRSTDGGTFWSLQNSWIAAHLQAV